MTFRLILLKNTLKDTNWFDYLLSQLNSIKWNLKKSYLQYESQLSLARQGAKGEQPHRSASYWLYFTKKCEILTTFYEQARDIDYILPRSARYWLYFTKKREILAYLIQIANSVRVYITSRVNRVCPALY